MAGSPPTKEGAKSRTAQAIDKFKNSPPIVILLFFIAIMVGTGTLISNIGTIGNFFGSAYHHFYPLSQTFQNIYTQSTSGIPVLDDPLRDNSKGYNWQELKDNSSSCAFTEGAYHVTESQQGSFTTCNAQSTNFFNFTLQVQMVIVKGDFGGILFRSDSTGSNAYIFGIYQDGSYFFTVVRNANGQSASKRGTSPAFKTGLNQPNLIAVVARGTNFYLYINGQFVDNMSDTSFGSGQVGVFAGDKFNPSDVAFSNLKIWQG